MAKVRAGIIQDLRYGWELHCSEPGCETVHVVTFKQASEEGFPDEIECKCGNTLVMLDEEVTNKGIGV